MTYKQYGKNSASLLIQKASFFEENKEHIQKQRKIANEYNKQPIRIECKNCNAKLSDQIDFTNILQVFVQ